MKGAGTARPRMLNLCPANNRGRGRPRPSLLCFMNWPCTQYPSDSVWLTATSRGCICFVDTYMTATIRKWGNSLAVRLPKALADEARIRVGAKVELVRTPEGLLVKAKRKPKPRYRLSDLLAGITPGNVHPETDWGRSLVKEILE